MSSQTGQNAIAQVTIKVTEGQEEQITILEGDSIEKVVRDFCLKWDLEESV